jgi:hypothetical protein
MTKPDQGEPDDRRWSGFSDYEEVAATLHDDINRAIDAYSHVDSRAAQNMSITPKTAVNTRSAILKITKRLYYEVKKNQSIEGFPEIHERWSGEDGYVEQLEAANFQREVPGFLDELIDDLVAAGWELGYLKAGMEKPANPESDDIQVEEMFE